MALKQLDGRMINSSLPVTVNNITVTDSAIFNKRPQYTDSFGQKLVAYDGSGFGWVVTPDLSGTGITLQPNPTFYRDFATLKTLDHGEGPNITFTRGSSATYFDSAGVLRVAGINEPRFDHDPVTGASLGLLIEEQRTNLLQKTEEFDNAAWISGGTGTVQANTEIAPNGSTSGDRLTTEGTTGSRYQSVAVAAETQYTFSVYVKLGTMTAGAYKVAFYDNTANTFISQDVVPAQLPSDSRWTRVSFTVTTPAGCTSMRVYPFRSSTPIPSSTVFFWGAQLEAGAFPTSYIPTTTTEATRAADSAGVEPISSFYNQSEGTLFAEWISGPTGVTSGTRRVAAFISSIIQDSIQLVSSATNSVGPYLFANIANVTGATAPSSPSAALFSSTYKLAGAWRTGQVSASINGGAVADSVGTEYPTNIQNFRIGRLGSGTELSGHIRKIAYWPKRLSNSFLQQQTQ